MLSNSHATPSSLHTSPEKRPAPSVLRLILEERLLSPLAAPSSFSLTDGFHAQDAWHAVSILSKFSRLFGESRESLQCERLIHAQINATGGDFLLSLPPDLCSRTPFDPRNPTVEMRPIGSLGWRIRIGDGFHRAEICERVGTKALKIAERLAYPIVPIPGLGGAAGFDAAAAALALRGSPLLSSTIRSLSRREMLLSGEDETHAISCSIGFWVDGEFLCSEGHHAFARRNLPVHPKYREQLFIDISSLLKDGTKFAYVEHPTTALIKTVCAIRKIMHDNFSSRSPFQRKRTSDLVEPAC